MNKNILKLLVAAAALAFTSCSQLDQPQSDAAGTLHIASVSIDGQEGVQTRVTYGETVTHGYNYNRSITSFQPGDQLMLDYSFGAETSYAYATYDGRTWKITSDKSGGTPIDIKPGAGEKWGNLKMRVWYDGGILNGTDDSYVDIARAMGATNGDVNQESSSIFGDMLGASNSVGIGTLEIDTDLNSPALGAVTIELDHIRAMLRLPMTDDMVESGTYMVDGTTYNVTGLATLWVLVKLSDDSSNFLPFTEVTIDGERYLQAIVPANPPQIEDQYVLDGFKAVLNTDNSSNITIDLPFKVDGTEGITLTPNTCYPLTLNISPNNAEVSLTSASAKPGWGTSEELLENPLTEPKVEYSDGWFLVSSADGLKLLNKWMTRVISTDVFKEAVDGVVEDGIITDENRMTAKIRLMEDITMPAVGAGESNWTPIGDKDNKYCGIIDGNGKKIQNISINKSDSDEGYAGFIGYMSAGGKVLNLTLENLTVTSKYVGGIVGCIEGNENNLANVISCKVSGTLEGLVVVGGIVGWIEKYANVTDCENHSSISSIGSHIGGIVGYSKSRYNLISNCSNYGAVNGTVNSGEGVTRRVGGVVGWNEAIVENCTNSGVVTVDASNDYYVYVGGIVGLNEYQVMGCVNEANVKITSNTKNRENRVGGIVGHMDPSSIASFIAACGNKGGVIKNGDDAKDMYVGGILGYGSYIYGCWTKDTYEVAKSPNYTPSSQTDGFGQGYNQEGCFSCYSKEEGQTDQTFINNKIDEMNTALEKKVSKNCNWRWVAGNDASTDWPTLKKITPADPS